MRYSLGIKLSIISLLIGIGVVSMPETSFAADSCKKGYVYDKARQVCKKVNGNETYVPSVKQCPDGYEYRSGFVYSYGNLDGCYKKGQQSYRTNRVDPSFSCEKSGYKVDPNDNFACIIDQSKPPEGSGVASDKQKIDETYARFGGSLNDIKNQYFTNKGKHLCSSQGCNEEHWKKMVNQCTQSTRQHVAQSGRYGVRIDDDKTKDIFSACLAESSGVTKEKIKNSVKDLDFPGIFGGNSAASEKACTDAGGTWNGASCDNVNKDSETDEVVSCSIEDGVGWLVCPTMRFLANVMDSSFNFLSTTFLRTDIKLLDNDNTRKAWGMMQQFANIAFVIIFLVIIYSQITGAGVSNYHIKTILPRLLLAAVFVNMSFILCQLAVDVSNTLGFSLKEFFDGLGGSITIHTDWDDTTVGTRALSAVGVIGAILAVTGGAAAIVMALSFPVIIAGVLALGLIVLILIGRTAFIILLTIIAPLAFAAWVLPNTRQLFNKWGKLFFSLLALFPIIATVFGASNFTASLLQGVSGSAHGGNDWTLSLMALAVSSIPLFVVPGLLKGALNATGQLGAKLSGISSSLNSKVGGKIKDNSRLGEAWKQQKFKSVQRQAQRRAGNSSFARFGRQLATDKSKGRLASFKRGVGRVLSAKGDMTQALDSSKLGGLIGGAAGAAGAAATAAEAENRQVEQMATLMTSGVDPSETHSIAKQQLEEAIRSKDAIKARAAQKILLSQGAKGTDTLQSVYKAMEAQSSYDSSSSLVRSLKSDLNGAGLKGKDAVLANWAYNGQTIDATQNDSSVFTGLNAVELAGQSASNLDQGVNIQAIRQSDYDRIKKSDAASSLLTGDKEAHLQRAKP